jgi:hypothetical protein
MRRPKAPLRHYQRPLYPHLSIMVYRNFKILILYITERGSSHTMNFIFLSPSVFSHAHVNKIAYLFI